MRRLMIFNKKGFITVPAALILAVTCLFELVLADAASLVSAKYFYDKRASLALESILASYDSVLFAKYELLGLNLSHYSEAETDFIKYISEPVRGDVISFSRLHRKDYELSFLDSFARPDGLKDAICSHMKYKSVANGAVFIGQALGLIKDAGEMTGAAADVAEGEKILSEAKEELEDLKIKITGLFSGDSFCVNGYVSRKYLFLLSEGRLISKAVTLDSFSDGASLIREALEAFNSLLFVYRGLNTDAYNIISDLKYKAGQIEKCAERAESRLYDINDESTRNSLKKSIARLRAEATVLANDGLVDPLRNNVEELNKRSGYISENILMVDAVYSASGERLPDIDTDIDVSKFSENLINALDDAGIRTDLKADTFYTAPDEKLIEFDSRKKKLEDLNIYSSDSYVVPDSVYATLPSVRADVRSSGFDLFDSFEDADGFIQKLTGASEPYTLKEAGEDLLNKYLICDYAASYLSDISQKTASAVGNDFICEKEYVLGGHKESEENIKTVSNLLLGIRFIFNFVHCYNDEVKHGFASEIGNAIAAALTGGAGGELFAILLIGAWSLAESYIDVKELRSGNKVPVIKTENTWKSSIDGLISMIGPDNEEEQDDEKTFALDYGQYLLLLMLLTPADTVLYRIADVIEINMTDYVGERYMLSAVFNKLSCKVKYEPKLLSPLFGSFGKERLEIEIKETASY